MILWTIIVLFYQYNDLYGSFVASFFLRKIILEFNQETFIVKVDAVTVR